MFQAGECTGAKKRFAEGLNSAWINWVLPRVVVLTACQFLVNFLLAIDEVEDSNGKPWCSNLNCNRCYFPPLISRFNSKQLVGIFSLLAMTPLLLGEYNE